MSGCGVSTYYFQAPRPYQLWSRSPHTSTQLGRGEEPGAPRGSVAAAALCGALCIVEQGSRPQRFRAAGAADEDVSEAYKHINGVVSNGVVPKSQICKSGGRPAPEICMGSRCVLGCFAQQKTTNITILVWRDKSALFIRPGLIRPGLCSPKRLICRTCE